MGRKKVLLSVESNVCFVRRFRLEVPDDAQEAEIERLDANDLVNAVDRTKQSLDWEVEDWSDPTDPMVEGDELIDDEEPDVRIFRNQDGELEICE